MRRALVMLAAMLAAAAAPGQASPGAAGAPQAITTLYPVPHPVGLMVTSGGWAYCEQLRGLARRTRHTLLCGRYEQDGYLGPGRRAQRHLDWGNSAYLAAFARRIAEVHRRVPGPLVLLGVSYSGFGVATLATHHPELRPDRLIVIDSYLDLAARRERLPDGHLTAREIDSETADPADLHSRSASPAGLARLIRNGTRLVVLWSVSEDERREFLGATCNRQANAESLALAAQILGRPLGAWVTRSRHGHDLWDHGLEILRGQLPGRRIVFGPDGRVPPGSVCRSLP